MAAALVMGLGAAASPARGNVNLELRPVESAVRTGDLVEIGLYAVSDDETDQIVRGLQVILQWDPLHLELAGLIDNGPYEWLFSGFFDDSGGDGLNADCGPDTFCDPYTGLPYNDGNAYYQAGANFDEPASATPDGLLVTTLLFNALEYTYTTEVWLPPAFGESTTTQVFGDLPAEDVTGTLGSTFITINPQVDWGLLAVEAPDAACGFYPGDSVTVLLKVSYLSFPINGVQALIDFDEDVLGVLDISPGDGAGSPWDAAAEVFEEADETITYAVLLLGGGADADAVVATMQFVVLPSAEPTVGIVELLPQVPPLLTKLTLASTGATIIPDLQGPALIAHPGDWDADADIDLADYSNFAGCMTGPEATVPLDDCCRFDFDRDDDVDLVDFAQFTLAFTGAYECQVDGDCDDSVACTDDTCVARKCVFTPNDANCPDDELFCNGTEYCDAVDDCSHTGDPCLGGPECDNSCNEDTDDCFIAAGTQCTDTDTDDCDDAQCNGAGACVQDYGDEPDGTSCDDALFCNGEDTCASGACTQHAGDPCPPGTFCDETSDTCETCPFTDDFNRPDSGTVGHDWVETEGYEGSDVSIEGDFPTSGNGYCRLYKNTAAITQSGIDTTDLTDIVFSYNWRKAGDSTVSDKLSVQWKPNASGTWLLLAEHELEHSSFQFASHALGSIAENTLIDIRFTLRSGLGEKSAHVDDVEVCGDWSGQSPDAGTDLTAATASATESDLLWTDRSDGEIGFEIERSTSGAGEPFNFLTTRLLTQRHTRTRASSITRRPTRATSAGWAATATTAWPARATPARMVGRRGLGAGGRTHAFTLEPRRVVIPPYPTECGDRT